MDIKKLVESFKRAIDQICIKSTREIKELETYSFDIAGVKKEIKLNKGVIVPDIEKKTMEKWLKINYIINQEFLKNEAELEKELIKYGL